MFALAFDSQDISQLAPVPPTLTTDTKNRILGAQNGFHCTKIEFFVLMRKNRLEYLFTIVFFAVARVLVSPVPVYACLRSTTYTAQDIMGRLSIGLTDALT